MRAAGGTLLLALGLPGLARGAALLAVRMWPARDYTRLTIEHDAPLRFHHFLLRDPPPLRLVVDIEGIDLSASFAEQVARVDRDDPYIRHVRVGQNRPHVVRLVIELKTEVAPQVFDLDPAGPYQSRLVFDLYPEQPLDPLEELLQSPSLGAAGGSPPTARAMPPTPPGGEPAPAAAAAVSSSVSVPTPAAAPLAAPIGAAVSGPGVEPESGGAIAADAAPAGTTAPASSAPGALATTASPRPAGPARSVGTQRALRRLVTVAVDPGHGGEDPGAVGHHGTYEKTVTLSIGRRLAALLQSEPDYRVLMTRDADFFVPLGQRVEKARRVQADLFVSIHADAWIRSDARGSSVFALSERGASSSAAAWLARQQNQADLIGGVNLGVHDRQVARVLLDLSTTAQINDSLRFGGAVLHELEHVNQLHKGRVEQASFAVLKAPDIPSILVETAFISNPDEEARLRDDGYQQQMAQAIFSGIRGYFAKYPPPLRNPVG